MTLSPPRSRARFSVQNGRIVREPDTIQTRTLLMALGLGLLVLVPLLLNVWGHSEKRRLGYEIARARQELVAGREVRRLLRTEIACEGDLAKVQERAISDMGLLPRSPEATVVVHGAVPAQVSPDAADPALDIVLARASGRGTARGAQP
jgi:hypothetical protein